MPLALETSGTTTPAALDTEAVLATLVGTKFYQLFLDGANLAADEALTIRWKYKVLTGGTSQVFDEITVYGHLLGNTKIAWTPPIASNIELVFAIVQSGGTLRAYPWKVLSW